MRSHCTTLPQVLAAFVLGSGRGPNVVHLCGVGPRPGSWPGPRPASPPPRALHRHGSQDSSGPLRLPGDTDLAAPTALGAGPCPPPLGPPAPGPRIRPPLTCPPPLLLRLPLVTPSLLTSRPLGLGASSPRRWLLAPALPAGPKRVGGPPHVPPLLGFGQRPIPPAAAGHPCPPGPSCSSSPSCLVGWLCHLRTGPLGPGAPPLRPPPPPLPLSAWRGAGSSSSLALLVLPLPCSLSEWGGDFLSRLFRGFPPPTGGEYFGAALFSPLPRSPAPSLTSIAPLLRRPSLPPTCPLWSHPPSIHDSTLSLTQVPARHNTYPLA